MTSATTGARYTWDDFIALDDEDTFRPESFDGLEIPLVKIWGEAEPVKP